MEVLQIHKAACRSLPVLQEDLPESLPEDLEESHLAVQTGCDRAGARVRTVGNRQEETGLVEEGSFGFAVAGVVQPGRHPAAETAVPVQYNIKC